MTGEVWQIVIVDDSPDDCAEARRLLLKGSDRRYAFTAAATVSGGTWTASNLNLSSLDDVTLTVTQRPKTLNRPDR